MTRHHPELDPGQIMGGLVPAPVVASPSDIPPAPDDAMRAGLVSLLESNLPWWRPSILDIARTIGWRWILLFPLLLVALAIPVGAVFFPHLTGQLAHVEFKLAAFAIAGVASIVIWGVKNVVKSRHDPFCVHCGYSLAGLAPSGVCPECGHHYLDAIIEEYRKDPHFFTARYESLRRAPRHEPFTAGDGPTPADGTQ